MKEGEKFVLYTSLLDAKIVKEDIILKYESRWDIEISIRETIMDINLVRAKSPATAYKEVVTALIAYNYIRRIMQKPLRTVIFPPKQISFKNTMRVISKYLWINLEESIRNGLRDAEDILTMQILKHKIPTRPGRQYPRKTKVGKYRKY